MLTLYQAEWCPYSSSVRQLLTEIGADFVARQVPARPADREELREVSGTDSIPVLVAEDGRVFKGTREIFGFLETLDPWADAEAHRQRYRDHLPERQADATGQLIERARLKTPR